MSDNCSLITYDRDHEFPGPSKSMGRDRKGAVIVKEAMREGGITGFDHEGPMPMFDEDGNPMNEVAKRMKAGEKLSDIQTEFKNNKTDTIQMAITSARAVPAEIAFTGQEVAQEPVLEEVTLAKKKRKGKTTAIEDKIDKLESVVMAMVKTPKPVVDNKPVKNKDIEITYTGSFGSIVAKVSSVYVTDKFILVIRDFNTGFAYVPPVCPSTAPMKLYFDSNTFNVMFCGQHFKLIDRGIDVTAYIIV